MGKIKTYSLEVFKKVENFRNLENISTDDVVDEFKKWEAILDSLSEEDYAEMITILCKQYTKEQLAGMVLSQMMTLKFNEFNLAFYEILKRKINMTKEEREEEKRRKQREVHYIIYNEILTDNRIKQNKQDLEILNSRFIQHLTKDVLIYPVKIKMRNYNFSEFAKNLILDKLRRYIKIID